MFRWNSFFEGGDIVFDCARNSTNVTIRQQVFPWYFRNETVRVVASLGCNETTDPRGSGRRHLELDWRRPDPRRTISRRLAPDPASSVCGTRRQIAFATVLEGSHPALPERERLSEGAPSWWGKEEKTDLMETWKVDYWNTEGLGTGAQPHIVGCIRSGAFATVATRNQLDGGSTEYHASTTCTIDENRVINYFDRDLVGGNLLMVAYRWCNRSRNCGQWRSRTSGRAEGAAKSRGNLGIPAAFEPYKTIKTIRDRPEPG